MIRIAAAFLSAALVAGTGPAIRAPNGGSAPETRRGPTTIDGSSGYVLKHKQERARLRGEVEGMWENFVPSTSKRWVEHSTSRQARSRVDFETGEVTLEALAASENSPGKARQIISRKIIARLKVILKERNGEFSPLWNQIDDFSGGFVTSRTARDFAERYLLPRLRTTRKPARSQDGKRRYRGRIKIRLVPGHLERRPAATGSTPPASWQSFTPSPALTRWPSREHRPTG